MLNCTVQNLVDATGWPHRLAWTSGSFRGFEVGTLGVRAVESSGHTIWSGDVGFDDLWGRHAPKQRTESVNLHFSLYKLRQIARVWRHKQLGQRPYDENGRIKFLADKEEIALKNAHEHIVEEYARSVGEPLGSEAI